MPTIQRRLSLCLSATLVAVSLASGCASGPAHDPAKAQASNLQDIGRQWKQGSELVANGEKARAKGQELVTEGREGGEEQRCRGSSSSY